MKTRRRMGKIKTRFVWYTPWYFCFGLGYIFMNKIVILKIENKAYFPPTGFRCLVRS